MAKPGGRVYGCTGTKMIHWYTEQAIRWSGKGEQECEALPVNHLEPLKLCTPAVRAAHYVIFWVDALGFGLIQRGVDSVVG